MQRPAGEMKEIMKLLDNAAASRDDGNFTFGERPRRQGESQVPGPWDSQVAADEIGQPGRELLVFGRLPSFVDS